MVDLVVEEKIQFKFNPCATMSLIFNNWNPQRCNDQIQLTANLNLNEIKYWNIEQRDRGD